MMSVFCTLSQSIVSICIKHYLSLFDTIYLLIPTTAGFGARNHHRFLIFLYLPLYLTSFLIFTLHAFTRRWKILLLRTASRVDNFTPTTFISNKLLLLKGTEDAKLSSRVRLRCVNLFRLCLWELLLLVEKLSEHSISRILDSLNFIVLLNKLLDLFCLLLLHFRTLRLRR